MGAPILVEPRPNARWSLDFVHDQFACGRRLRILNIGDDVTRQCLAAIPDTSISGKRVARVLSTLLRRRGKPGMIVSDHGTVNSFEKWFNELLDARLIRYKSLVEKSLVEKHYGHDLVEDYRSELTE